MAKMNSKNKLEFFLLETIRFSTYLILFTPLVVGFSFFFPFVGPKSLFFMAFAEIIFFSWLVLIFITPKYRPKFNLLLTGLIIYLFVLILASIFGVDPSYSFWSKFERMTGLLMLFHLFAFFLVLSSVFKEEDFKKFFGVSVFVALLTGFYAVVNLHNPLMRGGGTIGNESFLGSYLLFNLFFALYLIFKTEGLAQKFSLFSFFVLTFLLLLIGVDIKKITLFQQISAILFSDGARAVKVSFYGGLILLFLLWLCVSRKKVFRILGVLLLTFSTILVILTIFSLMFQPQGVVRKVVEKEIGSFGGRFPVWEGSIKGFLERPWLGWGPENFDVSFTKYFNPCMGTPRCGGEVWFDKAHNIIFDTLISAGIFGLISYFLIFFFSFFILWKNFLRKTIDFWTAGIFTSLFVAYFVQNLTVFDMVSSYIMWFLSLAFIASFEKERERMEEIRKLRLEILIPIIILFSVSFFKFIIQPTITDILVLATQPKRIETFTINLEELRKFQINLPKIEREDPYIFVTTVFSVNENTSEAVIGKIRYLTPLKRISVYEKTLTTSPLGKYQIREFFADTTRNFFYSLAKEKASPEEIEKEFDFVVEELKKTIKENPLNFKAYLKLGEILNIYSTFNPTKIQEAEEILKKAIELSPTNQQGYWALAYNMVLQRKFDKAISLSQKALDLEPHLKESYSHFLRIAKLSGNLDLAKQKYKEALKIPDWPPEWKKELKEILK